MKELTDLIEYENESSSLDFKSIQYKKEKYEDLLKDFISMANSITKDEKYIIVGVKHRSDGSREILGVDEDFIDEAVYQQLINSNIEPEIVFDYFAFELNNKKLGVFHLKNISNPPYMMLKDYGKLKKGDSFIRKGSHQTRITRKDIDFFIKLKVSQNLFDGKLEFSFYSAVNDRNVVIFHESKQTSLPSEKAAEVIRSIIKNKEEVLKNATGIQKIFLDQNIAMVGNSSYESRSIKTLQENLKNIKTTYYEDDNYFKYERNAHKINFYLFNTGSEYIEDATLEIIIKKSLKYLIVKEIPEKPDNRSYIEKLNYRAYEPNWDELNYPTIIEERNNYKIMQHIGNIKHKIVQKALLVPFRLVLIENCENDIIEMDVKIFARNLQTPICEKLTINIK